MNYNYMEYNYREAMYEDVKEYIENEINIEDFTDVYALEEYLNDILWCEDSVTGNASGSYTFSRHRAEEYICHNLDLLSDAIQKFGDSNIIRYIENPELADITIRCYLLGEMIAEVLYKMFNLDDDTAWNAHQS